MWQFEGQTPFALQLKKYLLFYNFEKIIVRLTYLKIGGKNVHLCRAGFAVRNTTPHYHFACFSSVLNGSEQLKVKKTRIFFTNKRLNNKGFKNQDRKCSQLQCANTIKLLIVKLKWQKKLTTRGDW